MSGLSFLKLMIIIEHIKMMETPYLDIYMVNASLDECLIQAIQSRFFGYSETTLS